MAAILWASSVVSNLRIFDTSVAIASPFQLILVGNVLTKVFVTLFVSYLSFLGKIETITRARNAMV